MFNLTRLALPIYTRNVVRRSSYICLNCFSRRENKRSAPQLLRYSTSFVKSRTAINPTIVPPNSFRDLHDSLKALGEIAGDLVSRKRLGLALRDLESPNVATRIGVLAAGQPDAALDLIEFAWADSSDPPNTRNSLRRALTNGKQQTVLLRSGRENELYQPPSTIPVITIDSKSMQSGNIEYLILNKSLTIPHAGSENSLISQPGKDHHDVDLNNFSDYPFHRLIVVGSGIRGLLEYSQILSLSPEISKDGNIKFLQSQSFFLPGETQQESDRWLVIQQSNASSSNQSLPSISSNDVRNWIESGTSTQDRGLSKVSEGLIAAVIRSFAFTLGANPQSSSAYEAPISRINEFIDSWAEKAHSDLQKGLDNSFGGKFWSRLAWWKLLWRVDDIDLIASDLLRRSWLVQAEKSLIWTCGRLDSATLLHDSTVSAVTVPTTERGEINKASPSLSTPVTIPSRVLWPQYIEIERNTLMNVTIPPLQSRAQQILFQSGSTILGTAALSGLIYAGFPSVGGLEAVSVGAFGLLYSLRRLQRQWGATRSRWENTIREQGRATIKSTEFVLRNRASQSISKQVPGKITRVEREKIADLVRQTERAFETAFPGSRSVEAGGTDSKS